MAKKWTNPYCPGTNTKRSQIVCAVIFISLTSENRRTRLLGLPAQSLRFPRYEGRTIGFEVNAKIQKKVFGTPHSWKAILLHVPLSFDSDINKRCDLFYTKIIFRSGRKSYALVQHLFPVHQNLVFRTFHGWCSVPITFGRPARTYRLLSPQKSVREFQISRPGNQDSRFRKVPGTND